MIYNFGDPPGAAANRALVDRRLQEVRESGGVPETLRVEFRSQPINVEVIDMPVSQLYYNPGTHRIRAQRSHDPERDQALSADPWGEPSQAYLQHLLSTLPSDPTKRDPRFDELRDSLRDHKQMEPGLITREGVLVNGNTRCAALRELAWPTIRVGVLPASTTWTDVDEVELTLQLRPDRRREYSYINHLLALDEQIRLGRPLPDIARAFHTTTPACERDRWILGELRDLIRRSNDQGCALRLMDFEDDQEKFFELYRAFNSQRNREKANLLKEARLAAIALDFAKTDIRFIDAEFQERFLEPRLPEELKPVLEPVAAVPIPGLNRSIAAAGEGLAKARGLTDAILKSKSVVVAGPNSEPKRLAEAAHTNAEFKQVFDEAIQFAGKDFRLRKKRQAAPDRVLDACKDLEQCVTDMVMARGSASLDQEAFDDALLKLRGVMNQLAVEARRSIELPGEGVAWLTSVAGAQR